MSSMLRSMKRSVQKSQGTFESARDRKNREARERIQFENEIAEWWQP